jgi:hypothetical protein
MTVGAEGVFYLFLIPSNGNLAYFHDSTTSAAPLSPLQGSQAPKLFSLDPFQIFERLSLKSSIESFSN